MPHRTQFGICRFVINTRFVKKKTAHAPPVVVPPEGVQTHALGKVPHPYTLVLAVAEEQVLAGVEQHRGHVVVVPATRVHLPRLFTNRGN